MGREEVPSSAPKPLAVISAIPPFRKRFIAVFIMSCLENFCAGGIQITSLKHLLCNVCFIITYPLFKVNGQIVNLICAFSTIEQKFPQPVSLSARLRKFRAEATS
jgi:hypothetical protein